MAVDRAERRGWRGKALATLLVLDTLLLVALIVMHRELASRIDAGASRGAFFPLHESYLTVFAAQWLASLGLVAVNSAGPMPEGRLTEAETCPRRDETSGDDEIVGTEFHG